MNWTLTLTTIAFAALFFYVGRKIMSLRDLLLIIGAGGAIGFLLAGAFHTWALLVGLLLLLAESFYLGFLYRERSRGPGHSDLGIFSRFRVQAAFVMSVALIVFLVFVIENGRQNVRALAGYIEIYQPHSSVEWVPRVDKSIIGQWMLKTDSDAQAVLDYYLRYAAREDWAIGDGTAGNFVFLQKDGTRISLMANDSEVDETTVVITIENADD